MTDAAVGSVDDMMEPPKIKRNDRASPKTKTVNATIRRRVVLLVSFKANIGVTEGMILKEPFLPDRHAAAIIHVQLNPIFLKRCGLSPQ